jgi:hypothetical protein
MLKFQKNIFGEKLYIKELAFLLKKLLVYAKIYPNIGFQEKGQFFAKHWRK